MASITTVISEKGQVTIPVMIRDLLGLQPFDRLIFSVEQEKIIASPVKQSIMDLYGSVKTKNKKPLDFKKLRRLMTQELSKKIALEGV